MRLYIAIVSALSRILAVIAMFALLAAVLVVSDMVFERYALGRSTAWQTEFTTYAIVAATFLGAPWVLIERGHVNVDLLQISVRPRLRVVLEASAGLASLLFVALLAYAGWLHFHEALSNGWTSDTVTATPLWIPLLPMPVGTGVLALQYIAELMRLFSETPSERATRQAPFADTTKAARP
ncbi:TRAP transporter small permease subunit [Aureimonas glaciei]|uniref:TRAP transporter small permease protein n=1 Tax=Aureimonas glaciei TaxID=1776957 RepID=A0A916XXH5_9HYPH|nr:TRAP transporter small permease [Aureimonas glaciei]GGD17483.1 TRAP transporter small permease protein [Aureimonas glaciei]